VRIYDIKTRKMLASAVLQNMVRAVDWEQSKGELIVVGDYKGKIHLYDTNMEKLDEGRTQFSRMKPRQSTYWIEDIKFSPNGKYVAFGAHGGRSHIEVFEIADNKFGKQIILNVGFTSALLHLDWNKGSDIIASVSQAY
jgi:WD40 repeat protein